QINSGNDVPPLIAASQLEHALVSIVKNEVIVGLQQRIAKLGKGNAVFRFQAPADGLFAKQTVDGEMLAHVAQEFHHRNRAKPVGVIDDERGVSSRIKIEKPA